VIESPYLTADEAAAYTRYASRHSFLQWVRRQGVRSFKRGKTLLFRREDLDAALAQPEAITADVTVPSMDERFRRYLIGRRRRG
jgi:excisionase family DNA binding protein